MTHNAAWLVGAATVRGTGHEKQSLPNQDAFRLLRNEDATILAAVVSDGAGSAPRAEEGARTCAEIMAQRLFETGTAVSSGKLSPSVIRDRVLQAIIEVRTTLDPSGLHLKDFHHTLTGLVITPSGGLVVQIGDSPAIITHDGMALDNNGNEGVDFFSRHRILAGDRGEYANETCFLTQPDWESNLRITTVEPDCGAVLLMSDGAGELILDRGAIYRPFIGTLIANMVKVDEESRNDILFTNLSHPNADSLTADDKTLLVIFRSTWLRYAKVRHLAEPSPPEARQDPGGCSAAEVTPATGLRSDDEGAPTTSSPQKTVTVPTSATPPPHGTHTRGGGKQRLLITLALLFALLVTFAALCTMLRGKSGKTGAPKSPKTAPAATGTTPKTPAPSATVVVPARHGQLSSSKPGKR